jgi:hemoglobin-like flavoprotein
VNQEQIMLVQSSWQEIEPLAGKLGEIFYKRLFAEVPEAQGLFMKTPREQGELLMSMLGAMVRMLDNAESLEPTLRQLGDRHRAYGVKDEYYAPFKKTLLWALGRAMDDSFGGQLRDAWSAMYDYMADLMQPAGSGE